MAKAKKLLPPIHPGEILREDFLKPLGLSVNKLALDLRVPVTRMAEIVHERCSITPDTALRLARYFRTSAQLWLNLQTAYDLEVAEDKLRPTIEREVRPAIPAEYLRKLQALERAEGSWNPADHPELRQGAARLVAKLRKRDEPLTRKQVRR